MHEMCTIVVDDPRCQLHVALLYEHIEVPGSIVLDVSPNGFNAAFTKLLWPLVVSHR